ncbi:hypothetical protein IFM89_036940 [Coptis chinensis]|uniref:Uncharacterized protein n=1 Tax=Coptis chinensis TaxID=261450 RepID=A0A835I058_9MAGN|nr:hypothetical protein IFM89_036940 [Coptis chinensis]
MKEVLKEIRMMVSETWREMSLALECSKDALRDTENNVNAEKECGHSFVLKDDPGMFVGLAVLLSRKEHGHYI